MGRLSLGNLKSSAPLAPRTYLLTSERLRSGFSLLYCVSSAWCSYRKRTLKNSKNSEESWCWVGLWECKSQR